MNLTPPNNLVKLLGIPRVSGDEPGSSFIQADTIEYSPRERG